MATANCPRLNCPVSFCQQGQKKSGVEHSWMALLSGSDLVQAATFVDFRDPNKFNDLVSIVLKFH